uniref:Odorant receptor 7 n=1 Tax=Macrocentrus cingulum TaxID=535359 RepID=A0A0H3U899_9HYME|nr:odorant receptor 7 [Macrocentrus cingulum]
MKIVLPIIYQESMYFIVHSAVNDWASVGHGKHREIMIRYAYIGRIVFMVQMIGAYMTIIPLIFGNLPSINPVLNGANDNTTIVYRNIPIGPNCWVSAHLSTNVYLAYYFLITLHLIILCTAYIGGDVYIFGIAMHVCGQFQLLYDNMEKLNANDIYFVQRINLSRLCQRHNHLVKLTNEFERTFNFVLLIQLLRVPSLLAFQVFFFYWASKMENNDIGIPSLISIYLLYFHLFFIII